MKRMKLTPMKVIKYKFGNMDILPDESGKWVPQTIRDMKGFVYKDEEHIIYAWKLSHGKLDELGRRLIKVYENGLEVDITPKYEEKTNEEND
jgi:hypothetical protein